MRSKTSAFRWDLGLVLILVLMGGAMFLASALLRSEGAQVNVRVDGETVKTFSLLENCRYEIQGADGGTNQLVIENGQVWLERADCPDKLCVRQGKIHRSGESIVCLPHKVVVEVSGETQSQEPDIVVGQ